MHTTMKSRLAAIALSMLWCVFGMTARATADYADEQGKVITFDGKQYIRVTDARQFVRSIISGQNILVARNTVINLTPLLDDEKWWNRNNPHFAWIFRCQAENMMGQRIVSERVDDGRQLSIVGFKDITIEGEGHSKIVVEPRYAFCLNFINCQNITIHNLTIGHTEGGNCQGGVIGVSGGSYICVSECNLYGCGTYGLQLSDTRDFTMLDSGIHDCTYGIMTLNNVDGARFDHCNFFRNAQYTLVTGRNSAIEFDRCRFYANNPTSPLFEVDRPFRLTNSLIFHPAEYLGTIDIADLHDNLFNSDPYDTASLGFEADPFIDAGHGPEKVKVSFEGSRPTIVDLINATIGDDSDEEGDCDNWIGRWKRYQLTGKPDPGDTYTVDPRNGYVRIESRCGRGPVGYHEFCFWNCDDGARRLFAHSSGLIDGGKAVETECTGLYFYLYDNATRVITYVGMDNELFGSRPVAGTDIAYQLPRSGKDINYVDGRGRRGTIKWDGNGFGAGLPAGGALSHTDEGEGEGDGEGDSDRWQLPMFVSTLADGDVILYYWATTADAASVDGYETECDPSATGNGALQRLFRAIAPAYTHLFLEDGTHTRVSYRDEQWWDPDGNLILPATLHFKPGIPNAGAYFDVAGSAMQGGTYGFIVTDDYLSRHRPLPLTDIYTSWDNANPLPSDIVAALEQRYGMKADRSKQLCRIGDGRVYGSVQFAGEWKDAPADDSRHCLALDVLADCGRLYVAERTGCYESPDDFGWNVDDGGEYLGNVPVAAFDGPDGLTLCCYHQAPESLTVGVYTPRDGRLEAAYEVGYRVMIDEENPVWKKDLAEMERLYAAGTDGHHGVKFTRWAHIPVDYANEWIWADDGQSPPTGAIFLRKDGQLKFITETSRSLQPTIAIDGERSYLSVSGPAGGPAWYKMVYTLVDGEIVETLSVLEVAGEITDCTLNGRPTIPDAAKGRLARLPVLTAPTPYFNVVQ